MLTPATSAISATDTSGRWQLAAIQAITLAVRAASRARRFAQASGWGAGGFRVDCFLADQVVDCPG